MHLSLIKSSPLRVQDQQYISLAASYSSTCSTHSTRNLPVACGMGNLCEQSFSLVCRRDEEVLYKRRTCKTCFKLKKWKVNLYRHISVKTQEIDVHREEKIHSQLKKVYEFLVSIGFPVQGVIYNDSSKLWLQFECNPVTSSKQ